MATNHLPPFSDANNHRGGILWKCTLCGRWYSLWNEPTLWWHLEQLHGITRASMDHRNGKGAA